MHTKGREERDEIIKRHVYHCSYIIAHIIPATPVSGIGMTKQQSSVKPSRRHLICLPHLFQGAVIRNSKYTVEKKVHFVADLVELERHVPPHAVALDSKPRNHAEIFKPVVSFLRIAPKSKSAPGHALHMTKQQSSELLTVDLPNLPPDSQSKYRHSQSRRTSTR